MQLTKGRNFGSVYWIVMLLVMNSAGVMAQSGLLYEESDVVDIESERIDIDGTWKKEERSSEEIIQEAKRKAEKNNVKSISKDISKMRIPRTQMNKIKAKEQKALASRVEKLFDDGESREDVVTTKPVVKVVPAPVMVKEKLPVIAKKKSRESKNLKVTPGYGVTLIKNTDMDIDVQSDVSASIAIESMVSDNVSFGIGFTGSKFDITTNEKHYNYGNGYNYNYNRWYGDSYANRRYNQYTDQYYYERLGRELEYKHYALELFSKFYLTTQSNFRPYLGIGVGYNMVNLQYTDQEADSYYSNTYRNYDYGNEEYNSSYVSGSARLGAEISLTRFFGLNMDFKYSRGLVSGINRNSQGNNWDQEVLDNLGDSLSEADFISMKGGVVLSF